jgi:cell division protein FtsZ
MDNLDTLEFDLPKNPPAVIKVIGVGGGGGNAVNHMYNLGIRGVDFFVCNTDNQALLSSPIPNRIQLGVTITEGLGAGANPEVGRDAAEESHEEITRVLGTNTKMVFITAGMGGGTGTGAAPVIARIAREAGILTVGILTTPFAFEGASRLQQAHSGIEEMRKHVDSLIVINNNKLREVYGNLGFKAGFAKADEVVAIAVRGIAEVITHQYNINIDLRDAKTVLNNSGTAIMGSGKASGEDRAKKAIVSALDSPLLNDNHIRGAKNVLLLIVSGQEEITIDEIGEINDHIQHQAGGGANIIMGVGEEEGLGSEIAVTVIATGFSTEKQETVIVKTPKRVVHTLEEDQEVSQNLFEKPLKNEAEKTVTEAPKPKTVDLFSSEIPVKEEPQITQEIEQPEEVSPAFEEDEIITFSLSDEDESVSFIIEDEEVENEVVYEAEPQVEADYFEEAPTELEDEVEIEAVQSQEEESQTEVEDKIVFDLEDYLEVEKQLNVVKPETKPQEEPTELMLKVKENKEAQSIEPESNTDPFNIPISLSMNSKNEERRNQLKAFNHRFRQRLDQIDDLSEIPAYKRKGMELPEEIPSKSERYGSMSVGETDKGFGLRGNNSFLHDNVD